MVIKMADDKETKTEPIPYIINAGTRLKSSLTKKHVLIAVVSLLIVGLLVTCVLVAIRMYTDHNLDVLKYKMTMKDKDGNNVTQDVSTDSNANIVQYHVVKDGIEAWVIQDFDKNIQVTKTVTDNSVGCYVIPLNRSMAADKNSIPSSTPKTDSNTPSVQLVYEVSDTQIADITYLGSRVNTMCKNIPTYWMEPSCKSGSADATNSTAADSTDKRQKRAAICATCRGYYCACGCCGVVCGRFATTYYFWMYSNGYYICYYYMYYVSCNISLRPYCSLYGRNWYWP